MKKIFSLLVSNLFENRCLICSQSSGNQYACSNCVLDFKERKENYTKNFKNIIVYSWGYYESKLRTGILSLKNGRKKLAPLFADILVNFWQNLKLNKNSNTIVIPVPSHPKRIKERGFCQSSLIASIFAKSLSLEYQNNFVERIKNTKHMNNLTNIQERKENIKNAFKINHAQPDMSNTTQILIIDDILTSGSTLCEIAKVIVYSYPCINVEGLTVASGDSW